jgi:hypothetical protein
MLSGRALCRPNPGVNAWAVLFNPPRRVEAALEFRANLEEAVIEIDEAKLLLIMFALSAPVQNQQ